MTKNKTYKSDISKSIHTAVQALHKINAIDAKTMRDFDTQHLILDTLSADDIKKIREKENVSQPVFAHYLGLSKNLISEWERGKKNPRGSSLRLLQIVHHYGLSILDISKNNMIYEKHCPVKTENSNDLTF